MDVVRIEDLAGPPDPQREPVCVILQPESVGRLEEAARWVGADKSAVDQLQRSSHRRAMAHVDGAQISIVAFATLEAGPLMEVHVYAGERGLLVVCPPPVVEPIRLAVAPIDGEPQDGVTAVLLVLGHLSDETVHRLSDAALALDAGTSGLTSGADRRDISRIRSQLFSLQQLWMSHQQMLASDDALAEALSASARKRVRRAHSLFESSTTTAAQLYALLGDTLSRQATVISERLTLVTVIFLPLTVSTGFFGMNFGWLTDHIGSFAAFVVLGIGVPAVLVAATMFGIRRFAGD
jgi:Mg2+ and Co2+ transporter CorA